MLPIIGNTMDSIHFVDQYFRKCPARCEELEKPFVADINDGFTFRIDRIIVLNHRELVQQALDGTIKLKFCIRPNDDYDRTRQDLEEWEVVLFPWFNSGMESADTENIHGEIVPYKESMLNGNLIIKNGKVIHLSTNHGDSHYAPLTNPIFNFITEFIVNHLEQ